MFGLEDRACAVLIREALKPFARAHPRWACHPAQVLLSGGLPAACDHLRQSLNAAPSGAVFVQIDAKRFFPSIACEGLAGMTGLPPEVIHRHLSVKHMDVRGRRSLQSALSVNEGIQRGETPAPSGVGREEGEMALGGIATGSAASSLVAEMVMGHILRDAGSLPGLIALIVYSDNIGAVVRSREEALAVQAAVLVAFNRSRAGPFSASKVSIKDVQPVSTSSATDGDDRKARSMLNRLGCVTSVGRWHSATTSCSRCRVMMLRPSTTFGVGFRATHTVSRLGPVGASLWRGGRVASPTTRSWFVDG